jgi:hypothetical protein
MSNHPQLELFFYERNMVKFSFHSKFFVLLTLRHTRATIKCFLHSGLGPIERELLLDTTAPRL